MHKLLKTKFYPVSIDRRVIVDDPHDKERTLAWKYKDRRGYIGTTGRHLMKMRVYDTFALESSAP